jgi:hypothetical protein
MPTRRVIKSVLNGFLGTYTSRYSDCDGYWLFGFLVAELGELRIDLLAAPTDDSVTPLNLAIRSAAAKFEDQLHKADLVRPQIREAWLTIQKLPGLAAGEINGVPSAGHNVRFLAGAIMDGGRRYEREQVVFVAPHNAKVELRSTRATEPDVATDTRSRTGFWGFITRWRGGH